MMMTNGRSNGRFPFTASQWQELEHQALIFKYMASGHPIPSDLILPIRRSMFLDSTSTQTSFYPNQPSALGWGCFQMGFGRKAEDPEPGRCRRTDGKKWRCSKEAHPDSKYCERHMHRGKNRSRKPVEMSLNNTSSSNNSSINSTTTTNNNNNNNNNNPTSSSTSTISASGYPSSLYTPNHHYHHSMLASDAQQQHHNTPLYPPYSSYHRPNNSIPQNQPSPHLHLDHSGSSSADRDYRYLQGVKDEVDQYVFFPETNGGGRDAPWRFTPLGLGEPKPKVCNFIQQEVGCYSHQLGPNLDKEVTAGGGVVEDKQQQQQQQQHCFVLGADFKMEKPTSKEERSSGDDESQRTLRHFFDEWPPLKSKESWMGLEEDDGNRSNWSSSFNKTQLSISTPMAHNDLSLQW